jgi:predicted anti-sigma-YlaC factor YlaD
MHKYCDNIDMECDEVRAEISAAIDEGSPVSDQGNGHLDGCDACRSWRERAHELRRVTLRPVAERAVPDLEVSELPDRFNLYRWIRIALGWGGVLLVGWNIIAMFAPGSGGAIHLERHQAAFGVALGLAFVFVAWRPDRAYGMVPFAAAFSFALGLSAIIDLVIGLALLWVLGAAAGPGRDRQTRRL